MKMYIKPLSKEKIDYYLQITDLMQDEKHVIHLLTDKVIKYVESTHKNSEIKIYRKSPVVTVADNYDDLLFPKDNISRSSTYTHYIDETHILRCHTTAHIPEVLRELAAKKEEWNDVVIILPGLVYRRDVTDKKHLGEVHQMDIWRIVKNKNVKKMEREDLMKVINGISQTVIPNWKLRIVDSLHPYTRGGLEVNATNGESDLEILECGVINDKMFENAGLNPKEYSGWALGMGIDRLVMALKKLPDIRYLRATNPKIARQMGDLEVYEEVSNQPAITRDMSYCVPINYVEEDICEDIREALGNNQNILETIQILSETKYEDLPSNVQKRLGINSNQKNVLVKIVLRALDRTLESSEANNIYNSIYSKINHSNIGYNMAQQSQNK